MENQKRNLTSSENNKPSPPRISVSKWLFRVIQGAIIGAGAILPGISGGVLCVVFGIYQPMMALLAHPIRTFRKYAGLLFPVLIGWVLGFVGLARLVDILFKASSNLAVWLFIGLIAGMTPSLFGEAGKEGRPKSAWISLILSTGIILAILLILQGGYEIQLQPNTGWFFFCGIAWGISLVIPGLSSSSLLIFLGLYQPMNEGIAALTKGMWGQALEVVIPLLIGILLFVFVSARAVNYIFKHHYAVAFHTVIGFVIASTIAIIIPMTYSGVFEILLCALSFAVGFIGAWLMDRLSRKVQRPELEKEKSKA